MTAYIGNTTGIYASSTTWSGAGIPGAGDTETINAGVAVNSTGNVTVGTSPVAGTTVVALNGTLDIDAGTTFTVRGNIVGDGTATTNGQLTCDGGLVFDGTSGGVKYQLEIGTSVSSKAKLLTSNNSANRPQFSSLNTAACGWIAGPGTSGTGMAEIHYGDFKYIGDSTNFLFNSFLSSISTNKLILDNCTFDHCGRVQVFSTVADVATLTINQNIFTNGTDAGYDLKMSGAVSGAGIKSVTNNRFTKPVQIASITNTTVNGNYFGDGYSSTFTTLAGVVWSYNFVDTHSGNTIAVPGADHDIMFDGSANNNPHMLGMASGTANQPITNCIFDAPWGLLGDMFTGSNVGKSISGTNCLVLPNAAGTSPGKFISPTGVIGTIVAENNTICVTGAQSANGEMGVGVGGETTPTNDSTWTSCRGNYAWTPDGTAGVIYQRVNTNFTGNPFDSPAHADYNAFNAPVTATGSGVQAVVGAQGGYTDANAAGMSVRISLSAGAFTLYCYAADGTTHTETVSIANGAIASVVAAAVQTALNANGDGTYIVTGSGTLNSTAGVVLTATQNSVALTYSRINSPSGAAHGTLTVGGTNTTGGTVWCTIGFLAGGSSGIGAHDIVCEPLFRDAGRNTATFDTAYLGNTATAWSSLTAYTAASNAVVSSATSGVYNNKTINYHCIQDNTNIQPGVTSGWQSYWEFATCFRIKNSIAAYNAAVRQATPQDLITWIFDGYRPGNQKLQGKGFSGGDIGCMPVTPNPSGQNFGL